jgi:hypothetical protein
LIAMVVVFSFASDAGLVMGPYAGINSTSRARLPPLITLKCLLQFPNKLSSLALALVWKRFECVTLQRLARRI